MENNYKLAIDFLTENEDLVEENNGHKLRLKCRETFMLNFDTIGQTIVNICYNPEININMLEGLNEIPDEYFAQSEIEKFNIPEGIKLIGNKAFYGCTELKEVNFANSVISIQSGAFSLSNVEKIILPDNIYFLGRSIFGGCSLLEEIKFSDNITVIDAYTCLSCEKLSKVDLPKNLRKLDALAFGFCTNLKTIIIPNSVVDIHDRAFAGCEGITIELPKNNKRLQEWAKNYQENTDLNFEFY